MASAPSAAKLWIKQQTAFGRRSARAVVAFGLLNTLLGIGQAFCIAGALSVLLGRSRLPWTILLGAYAGLAVLRAGSVLLADHAAFEAGAAARRRLRSDTLARLLHSGPALLRDSHSGQLAAIVIDRIEALDGLFARWLPASALALAAPALVVVAALVADPVAAAVLVGAGLLVPVGMAAAGIGAAAASRRQFFAMARLQTRFLDRVRGIATIVLAGRAEAEAEALASAAAELRRRTMRVLRVAFLSSTVLDCAAVLALIGLAIHYGAALAAGAQQDPTRPFFALLLVAEFFAPLRSYSAAYQDRLHATTAAEALAGLPALPPEAKPQAVRNVAARGVSVAFENVSLTWDSARGPALTDLSFRVPPGETLILAGPSGAGKSTIIEILLGFVRPDAGRATINGADLASLVPQALARLTAWIGQRPVLFAGSISDNIRFARPEATEAEVEEAARQARIDTFAADLPDGLQTLVGEDGYGLSGGQAQRVAIARAYLKNAPLLLLDEPTAHLDPTTEAEVLDSLRRLALGRTVILASHSTAAHAFGGRRLDLRDGRALPARGAA